MNEETKDLIRKQFDNALKFRRRGYLEVHDHMMGCFSTLIALGMVEGDDLYNFTADLNDWFHNKTPDSLKENYYALVGCDKA